MEPYQAKVAEKTEAGKTAIERPQKTKKLPDFDSIREDLKASKEKKEAVVEDWMDREDPFDEQQLRDLWQDYLNILKERKKDVEFATLNRNFEVRDGHNIFIKFNNSVQVLTLEGIQQDLVTYLRKSLMNRNINVKGEVELSGEKKMVYTNREKFEYLSDKYPMLRELRDKLDLDTDF